MEEIKTIKSKVVYKNKWMTVKEDKIVRINGIQGIYGIVNKTDFAVIVPIMGDQLILVNQYRYPVKGRYWEFPQGAWEQESITPEDLARAELQEETGYAAGKIDYIGQLFVAYGYSNQGYSIFFANELLKREQNLDEEEIGLISKKISIKDVEKMILTGEIKDATTVATFGLLRMKNLL